MKIFITRALEADGYSIALEMEPGTIDIYPKPLTSPSKALGCARVLADEIKKETGVLPELFVSVAIVEQS